MSKVDKNVNYSKIFMARKCLIQHEVEMNIMVNGGCMNPYIYDGDYITVRDYKEYNIGDIVVFNYNNMLVHRIVGINSDNFVLCKGDNCYRIEIIDKKDILGKVYKVNGKDLSTIVH